MPNKGHTEAVASPHMFWHCRSEADPLQVWLRAAIRRVISPELGWVVLRQIGAQEVAALPRDP